jgi:hypothetical protein
VKAVTVAPHDRHCESHGREPIRLRPRRTLRT